MNTHPLFWNARTQSCRINTPLVLECVDAIVQNKHTPLVLECVDAIVQNEHTPLVLECVDAIVPVNLSCAPLRMRGCVL